MTHSLHRQGSVDSLKKDYTFIVRALKREGFLPRIERVLDIMLSEEPVNMGCSSSDKCSAAGLEANELRASLNKNLRFVCTFSSKDKVLSVLKKLKDADAGVSVVLGGLIKEIVGMSEEVGIKPHTANISLGLFGKKKTLLPGYKTLCLTTMCGHGMISTRLAEAVAGKVKSGKLTPKEGAYLLAKNCPCGLVNLDRCEELFTLDSEGLPP
ncbi:MAG: hypothetical protein AB1427_09600 [Thermodesulfobacteriota bacterium]